MRVMDFWWDVYGAPGASVPSTLMNQSGSNPPSTTFWTAGTGFGSHPVYSATIGRDVFALGTSAATGGVQTTFSFPLMHDKALVVNKVSAAMQVVGFEIEMAASALPTDATGGKDENIVGIIFTQSDGTLPTGSSTGILGSSAAFMAMMAAHDGNWYFFAGTKSRAGSGPFPADCCTDQLICGTNTTLHKFRFLFKSATSANYGSLDIYVDDATTPALHIDWNPSNTPRLPGYGSGVFPWWRIMLVGDKTTGGTNGGVNLLAASSHFFSGPDDPAVY